MASLKKEQQDTIASIDAAKAIDKILAIIQLIDISPALSFNIATNPMEYVLQLLSRLGVTREELENFISNFLVGTLPALEIAVKAILLTNLKNMITCTTDPRIPDKYRKRHKVPNNVNTSQEYGIDISLESIDFFNKLSMSPLSTEGKGWYFGLDGVTDVYKFARAEDFDAYLWFVIHKGKFPNSSSITNMSSFTDNIHGGGASNVKGNSLLEVVEVNYNGYSKSSILPGNTFTYTGSSHVISMCIDSQYDKDNKIVKNTLVPVSDDWNSVNWYVRRADQLTKNLGIGSGATRDYNKERGICNIQFLDQASGESPLNGLVNNKFRFTILPKPIIHTPNISNGEPPWRFKKLLFNSKGEYDPNGKYTLDVGGESQSMSYLNGAVEIDQNSGKVIVNDKDKVINNLIECYCGLTIFEFNYDYVMSIRLFDVKVIAKTLLDTLLNIKLGLGFSVGMEHQNGTEEIKEIIKSILEADDISVEDCFFEFNNAKYDALLRNAEERKAKKRDFSDIEEILNGLDDTAELNEQVDILKRTFNQVSVNITEGLSEEDKTNVRFDFVTDLIEQLTFAVVQSLLSPKVLMLLEVNETIMGGKWKKFTVADLIKAMRSIIIAVIKEIRDLILQELLKLLLKVLSPIISVLTDAIVREQLESYADVINDIIRNCPTIWFNFGNRYMNTKLDTVDYADIDTSETKRGEKPQLNNC